MKHFFRTTPICLLLFACQTTEKHESSEAQHFDSIPFSLTSHNNLSVEAVLNQTDTVCLMFHTASSSVTLTSQAIQGIESVQWGSEQEVNSWGGASSARYSSSNNMKINGLLSDSIPIWETQNSGPGTDGKFGPNLFAGKVIQINFEKNTMLIGDSLPKNMAGFEKVSLHFEDDNMFIKGISKINNLDFEQNFLIHTGYGGTILYDDNFVQDTKIGDHIEILDEKELKDSYGNTLTTKKGILPKFVVGNQNFDMLPVGFFEGTIGRQQMSVIGGDLIKRFNIILDSERAFIYLKPNALMNEAYTAF